jgi:enterochelin esterase-like enzyme
MQPVSGSFIALLIVVTIGCLALTVWTWGWQRLRFVRRMATLGTTQLMVVLCVVAAINASQNFFVTWDDILEGGVAADPGAAPVVALPNDPQGLRATAGSARYSQLGPAVAAAERAHRIKPRGGVMVSTVIRGSRTGYRLPSRLYFPAAYFDAGKANHEFPVVEFFTGYYGGLDIFQRTLGANNELDKLIESGKMPPVIVVIPEQNPNLPTDSECVNAVRGDQAETYVALDVPDVLKSDLRVSKDRRDWALMGYSTGGFCAANIAIHHSELFSMVISLSGYFHPVTDSSTGDTYKGDKKVKRANNPTLTIALPRRFPLAFYLATSTGDGEGMRGLKEFGPKIHAPDRLTKVIGGHTGHNFTTWKRAIPAAFTWLGKELVSPPPMLVNPTAKPDPAPDPVASTTPPKGTSATKVKRKR